MRCLEGKHMGLRTDAQRRGKEPRMASQSGAIRNGQVAAQRLIPLLMQQPSTKTLVKDKALSSEPWGHGRN